MGDRLPEKGDVILLRTAEGIKVVLVENIKDVTFKTPHKARLSNEQFRNALTLKLRLVGRQARKDGGCGSCLFAKGSAVDPELQGHHRWGGNAAVKLQATVLNELTDLNDVSANLVIGVPTFAFKDSTDPIALQKKAAELSQYFQGRPRADDVERHRHQTARMVKQRAFEWRSG